MVPCELTTAQAAEQIEWILVEVSGETHEEVNANTIRAMSEFCTFEGALACVHSRTAIFFDRVPEISFKVYFPHWVPSPLATTDAVSYWAFTLEHLCRHELGHVDIGLEWRRYVAEELLSEPVSPMLWKSLWYVADQAYLNAQETYDRVTEHGARMPRWKPTPAAPR